MESPTTAHGSPAINGFGSGVFVAVGVGVAEAVAVGVEVGVGLATGTGSATPLFHTSFLPLFTHVYFMPPVLIDWPALAQMLPGFGAGAA